MSIKHKYIFVCLLIAFGILSLLGLYFYKIGTFNLVQSKLDQMTISSLELRRNEKDFLARLDLQYQTKFNQEFDTTKQTLKALEQALTQVNIDGDELATLQRELPHYQTLFNQLVSIQQQIGLSPEEGLFGQLRQAFHQAEATLTASPSPALQAQLLQLRRNEKDFLNRREDQYLTQFEQNYARFLNTLPQSKLTLVEQQKVRAMMQAYAIKFQQTADMVIMKGLDEQSGIQGEMRKAVHDTENAIQQISQQLNASSRFGINNISNLILTTRISTFVMYSLLLGLIIWVIRSLF